MANVLGFYNPEFYATEALLFLGKRLGIAGRVHRGAEEDRNGYGRSLGDTINLRRPTKFTAAEHVAGTGSSAQAVASENVSIQLNSHQEVKFAVSDREKAYSGERLITEHIEPAVNALVYKIDSDVQLLGAKVGPKHVLNGTASVDYITGPRKVLRANECPDGMVHYSIDYGIEKALVDMNIFHSADTAGQGNNATLFDGSLGVRFGVETFVSTAANQAGAALTSTATASAGSGDSVGAVNNSPGGYSFNATQMAVNGFTGSETVQIGDTFKVAGDDTTYILTAATTMSSGAGTLTFFPALRKPAAHAAVVTFNALDAVEEAAYTRNLMFHRNAFGLAFADLGASGNGKGAAIFSAVDEQTGLAVRVRMFYGGDTATESVAFDVLYGTQVLDGNLAVRALRAATAHPASN